eukprot:1540909-Prymnesium_polylepis.1
MATKAGTDCTPPPLSKAPLRKSRRLPPTARKRFTHCDRATQHRCCGSARCELHRPIPTCLAALIPSIFASAAAQARTPPSACPSPPEAARAGRCTHLGRERATAVWERRKRYKGLWRLRL